MKDLITIIIPVYNVEKYLDKCIESVILQTYKNLQIILVDDGSTDSSPKICDDYAKKYKNILVIHKENGGLSSARNAGLKAAKGDYITFLDSDDYVASTLYDDLYKALNGNKDRIACTNYRRADENGKIYEKKDIHKKLDTNSNIEYLRELLLHIGDVSTCTKLFPKEVLVNQWFDEEKLNEDLLFMVSIISKFKTIVYTGTIGYYYLIRKNSISSGYGKAIEDMALNSIVVNQEIQNKFKELKEEGYRFALFQNMAYLLLVPDNLRTKNNIQYVTALKYIKKFFIFKGITNKYLTIKNKIIILGLIVYPEFIIKLFQRKRRI